MMAVTSGTIEVVQGGDVYVLLTAVDSVGTVIDLSTATMIEFKVYETITPTAVAVIYKSEADGDITLPNGGADGIFQVDFLIADFADLEPANCVWQGYYTIGALNPATMTGTFTLVAGGASGNDTV